MKWSAPKLPCSSTTVVPGPHYYSARPGRLRSRGPNEDPVRRTRGTNQEQANMAEKWVDGKGFVFFTEVFVRIQVYPLKGKRTIKKGA